MKRGVCWKEACKTHTRAGHVKAHFCSTTERKALMFSRQELASRGVEVGICE